jgi:hypothetical protein
MSEIYLLSDGDYSDYHIKAIFSTPEKRAAYKAIFGGSDEDMELDPEVPQEAAQGLTYYEVCLWKNGDRYGDVKNFNAYSLDEYYRSTKEQVITPQKFYRKDAWEGRALPDTLYWFYMWAENPVHAVKIANERRLLKLAGFND